MAESPDEMPTLKSVGLAKIGGGYVSYTLTSKGKEVLSISVSDADMRPVAEDQAKIAFVENFMGAEL